MKIKHMLIPTAILATASLPWIIGSAAIQAQGAPVKEVKVSQQATQAENSTLKAALAEFKTEVDFETWLNRLGDDYSDETKLIAVPEPSVGTGWAMGSSRSVGTAGTVTDENGKVIAEYSFDNPSQVTTIGKIKEALIARNTNVE